jgi:hypothetical protein
LRERTESENAIIASDSGGSDLPPGKPSFLAFVIESEFKLRIILLSLLVVCSGTLLHAGHADAKSSGKTSAGKKVGWVLDQTSEEAGRGEIIITQDGVRIKLKSLTAFVNAPKFDATIFDTSSKKYVELSYKQWTSKYKSAEPLPITALGRSEVIGGLKSTAFRVPSKKVVKQVWFTDDIPVSDDMCAFISTTMHLPGGHGLPVRMETFRPGGAKRTVFDTLKVTRSTNLDPKIFQRPDGFKKVDSEYQLFLKENQVKDLGGFFQ